METPVKWSFFASCCSCEFSLKLTKICIKNVSFQSCKTYEIYAIRGWAFLCLENTQTYGIPIKFLCYMNEWMNFICIFSLTLTFFHFHFVAAYMEAEAAVLDVLVVCWTYLKKHTCWADPLFVRIVPCLYCWFARTVMFVSMYCTQNRNSKRWRNYPMTISWSSHTQSKKLDSVSHRWQSMSRILRAISITLQGIWIVFFNRNLNFYQFMELFRNESNIIGTLLVYCGVCFLLNSFRWIESSSICWNKRKKLYWEACHKLDCSPEVNDA